MNETPPENLHPRSNTSTYLLMVLTAFFWSGAFIAGKYGVDQLTPVLLTFLRMGIAVAILFPILLKKQPTAWRLSRGDRKYVLASAIIGMIGYHVFFFHALALTSASKASIIQATNPLITAVLAAFFAGETLNFKKILLLLVALLGVVNILVEGNLTTLLSFQYNAGDFFMLTAAFMMAIYSIIVRRAVQTISPLKLMTYTFLYSTLLLSPFGIYDLVTTDALHVGYPVYLAVLYMGIFPSVIGYSIQQISIARIGPSRTSLFINLVPLFSSILAVLIFKESIESYHLVSAILILGAVFFYTMKQTPTIRGDTACCQSKASGEGKSSPFQNR